MVTGLMKQMAVVKTNRAPVLPPDFFECAARAAGVREMQVAIGWVLRPLCVLLQRVPFDHDHAQYVDGAISHVPGLLASTQACIHPGDGLLPSPAAPGGRQ